MSNITSSPLPRQIADAHVDGLIELDPIFGTYLGAPGTGSRLPDFSPAGANAVAALARTTLDRLTEAEARPGAESDAERRLPSATVPSRWKRHANCSAPSAC